MDSVTSMLLVAAAWVVVVVRPERRALAVIGAGAIAGLAFEVKLFEGAVALPALGLLAWLALDATAARKARTLALGGVTFLVVASGWAVVASLLPGHHPYPMGSTNGQIWNAILDYNGIGRFGHAPTSATAPGLDRLFEAGPPRHFGELIGVEMVTALAFGGLAAVTARRRGPVRDDAQRRRRAIGWGLGAWLVIGALVASFMGRQWPRYLEAFTPAVAGVFGIAIATVGHAAARRRAWLPLVSLCAIAAAVAGPLTGATGPAVTIAIGAAAAAVVLVAIAAAAPRPERVVAAATALVVVAALAVPLATSVRLVRAGEGDSAAAGNLPPAELEHLSAYLRAHQGDARYEMATASIWKAASVIIRDVRPVLTLASVGGRPLVSPAQLAAASAAGDVRFALIGGTHCTPDGKGAGCAPVMRWVRANGTDVSRAAGLPRRGILYRLPGAGAAAATGSSSRRTGSGPGSARTSDSDAGGQPRVPVLRQHPDTSCPSLPGCAWGVRTIRSSNMAQEGRSTSPRRRSAQTFG